MGDIIHHSTRRTLHSRLDKLFDHAMKKSNRIGMIKWIETFLKITPPEGGIVPFRLNHFQKKLAAIVVMMVAMNIPVRIIILKSRKLGFSTLVEAILFYMTWLKANTQSLIVAHDQKTTQVVFEMTKKFHDNLVDEQKRPLHGTKENLKFLRYAKPHNSIITPVTAGVANIARGMTPQYVHFSELAFWPYDEDSWTSAETAVPPPQKARDTMIIVESTALGTGNVFHKLWEQAYKPESPHQLYRYLKALAENWDSDQDAPWIGLFFSWKDDPDCQIPWSEDDQELDKIEREYMEAYSLTLPQVKWARRTRGRLLDIWEKFHQEYPCDASLAFKFSGYPVFAQKVLKEQLDLAKDAVPVFRGDILFDEESALPRIKLQDNPYGSLYLWGKPKIGEKYCVGMDVSEGLGGDYTEIVVLTLAPVEVIGYFYSNSTSLIDASVIAYLLGCYFNWALLGVERNAIGQVVLESLRTGHMDYPQMGEYPFLYYHTAKDRITNEVQQRVGFQTNQSSKRAAITHLRELIFKNQVKLNSIRIINQLIGFGLDPTKGALGKYTQKCQDPLTKSNNDDAVMALAIAEQMRRAMLDAESIIIRSANW